MTNRYDLNKNLAQMLKGGVIMDVQNPEQARIAEAAGAAAVMALERIPADIRAVGGVSRMSDPKMIKEIQDAVSIPVMAKVRIGHFVEAQILQAIEIDYIDESEVLTPADDLIHVDKTQFDVPFVCGAKDLGEALRRISEGASMIRTKGEPGTGDIVQAVHHLRLMNQEIRRIQNLREDELYITAKDLQVPIDLVRYVHEHGKLPVVNFAAGGVATPADAALMMQLGAEGVFVGSGIFKSGDPKKRAEAIVKAVTNYNRPDILAQVSEDLGEAMVGINKDEIDILMAERGKQMTKIGILALQGAFAEHEQLLKALGVETVQIRNRQDWEAHADLDGLILPGGESTVMGKLLHDLDLFEPIKAKIDEGLPVFGTCAGLILLAKTIVGDQTNHLASMDINVARNAYGRQLVSFVTDAELKGIGEIPMVFIRGPIIEAVGAEVEILAQVNGAIVAAREKQMLVTSFHPELTGDERVHAYFLDMINQAKEERQQLKTYDIVYFLTAQKNPGPKPWIQEIMKKKSFRMVIVYKAKPKVFLKGKKKFTCDMKKEVDSWSTSFLAISK